MLHELSHALDPECSVMAFARSDRGERELVAESAAYIVAKRLGLDTDDCSTFYVASWKGEPAKLQALAGRRGIAAELRSELLPA